MKTILTACFLFLLPFAFGQSKNFLGFEYSARYGILLAHQPLMEHLPKTHTYGGELSFYFQTQGASEYSRLYNHPKFGLTLIGTALSNNQILGQEFGIVTFGDFPFHRKNRDELTGTIGLGLTYITKTYHPTENYKNTAIGSHLNAFINIGIKYRHFFNEKHYFVLGLNFTHSSNGAIKMPNLGLNLVQFNFGFGHQFKEISFPTLTTALNVDKRWKFTLYGVGSFKEEYPIGGRIFPIANLSFIATKRFNKMNGIELYADGFYRQTRLSIEKSTRDLDHSFQAGIFIGYNLYIHKIRVITGIGGYVFDQHNVYGRFYHRLGVKYQINKHLVTGVIIKTHWARADYIEYGIGYTF